MSEKQGFQFRILDTQNAATAGDKGVRQIHQNVGRRKLADISNLQQNQRPLIQENKSQCLDTTTKEYIVQLQKEKMVLVSMLAQRNKNIEQIDAELDRLRVNIVKMQEQNQQIALANPQMLLEINSDKDRMEVLQHEIGYKSSLLKVGKLELEDKEIKMPCKNAGTEFHGAGELAKVGSSTSDKLKSKQKIENKRHSARRQSTRSGVAELKPSENSFQTDDIKVPTCPLPENSLSENASVTNEGNSEQRRPKRQAAGKVQSYKEIPINIKMRRP